MLKNKKILIIGLIVPIIAMAYIVIENLYILKTGIEITLPIKGYDPRDLLSGNYLSYTIDYGVPVCPQEAFQNNNKAYVCLDPKEFSFKRPENCNLYIQGLCQSGHFNAGLESFYATELEALELDKIIRQKTMSVVLSVAPGGSARVKALLVDGKLWKASW